MGPRLALIALIAILILVLPAEATIIWYNFTAINGDTVSRLDAGGETWADLISSNGNMINGDTFIGAAGGGAGGKFSELDRNILIFDTSSLPDDLTISSGFIQNRYNWYSSGLGNMLIGFTDGTATDPLNLIKSDYEKKGSNLLTNYIDISNDANTWNYSVLNNVGKSYINKEGYTIFFGRPQWDIIGSFTGDYHTDTAITWLRWDSNLGDRSFLNLSVSTSPGPTPAPPCHDTINIQINKTGDNFILWRWDQDHCADNLTKTIFINGEKMVDNGTLGYYLLSGINPDEEHVIEIWGFNRTLNTLNTTALATNKTYEQNVWTLFLIGTALLVIGWFTAPVLILASVPAYLLGFAMSLDMTNQSYIILTYGLAAILSLFITVIRWVKT